MPLGTRARTRAWAQRSAREWAWERVVQAYTRGGTCGGSGRAGPSQSRSCGSLPDIGGASVQRVRVAGSVKRCTVNACADPDARGKHAPLSRRLSPKPDHIRGCRSQIERNGTKTSWHATNERHCRQIVIGATGK